MTDAVTEQDGVPAAESEPALDETVETTEQTTDGESEQESTPDAEDTTAEQDQQPKQGKGRAKKRIRQLNRELRSEREQRLKLQERVDGFEKRLPPDPATQRPDRQSFDSDADYEDALFEWRDKSTQTVSTDGSPGSDVTPEAQQKLDDFESRLDDISDEAADIVLYGEDWPVTPIMTEYCTESEHGAALALHLATHHDVAERITKLSPIMAVRELEKLEKDIPAATTGVQDPPPPPASAGKPGGSSVGINEDDMSDEQWNRLWKAGKLPSQQKA